VLSLSPDQEVAYDRLVEFLESPVVTRRYITLHGLAGVGKTALLGELIGSYPGLTLTAYTGKAASVLRSRVGVPVTTLHSVIYDFQGMADDEVEGGRKNPIFTPKGEPLQDQVILVDEASMLGQKVARDLLDTGARVIAAGDPGQLPPVQDSQFFVDSDLSLTTIHRQALESPIIRQAHMVRSSCAYHDDGDGFRVVERATPEDLIGHDMLLCWRNKTRLLLNARKRSLLGHEGGLQPGEPVMCLRNDHRLGLYNGAVYSVVRHLGDLLSIQDDGRRVIVDSVTIEGLDPKFSERRYEDDYLPFALAYASTVHKAQGSEYKSVLLIDECFSQDWKALTYTGITRAVERCTVVRWR
jgi:ATP-dependent exoDNAse (exonuclease V) alpha subunit